MTDSATSTVSLDGDAFTLFESHFCSCSNTFSTSTESSNNYIELRSPSLLAASSGYYGSVSFWAEFSDFRSTFFSSSSIKITFSAAVLTDYTRCWFDPESSFWSTYSIDATRKIYTLNPSQDIQSFTAVGYQVTCSNIITTGASFTVKIDWYDSSVLAQTSISSLSFDHSAVNSVASTGTGTLVSKLYNTNHYLAEYQFNLTLTTTTDHSLDIRIGFPLTNIHKNFL